MNRKKFLSSTIIAACAAVPAVEAWGLEPLPNLLRKNKLPPYLKPGSRIGITSPAGFISREAIQSAVQLMESWGFIVVIGSTIGQRDFTYGGTDQERILDLQKMLDDPGINAIMCARGGYGLIRIIDQLNFDHFVSRPKWLLGFSDITVLHCHINRNYEIATIHSKMCNSFPGEWIKANPIQISTIFSIRQALTGENYEYTASSQAGNRLGTASGILVGGNLSIIETLAGTNSDLETKGKILFVEDTGEYLYSIDRMFWNLKRTGKLSQLAGLVVGGFKVKPDDPDEEFGKSIVEIVMEKVNGYQYPVCFGFPIGHQMDNYALKCGVRHLLNVSPEGSTLHAL
jgi:muramoyltetrapeptide carboxypeptidase